MIRTAVQRHRHIRRYGAVLTGWVLRYTACPGPPDGLLVAGCPGPPDGQLAATFRPIRCLRGHSLVRADRSRVVFQRLRTVLTVLVLW